MNRKIKYLFFLVSFITVNIAILILVILSCIVLSEFVFAKIQVVSLGFAYFFGLLLGVFISITLYRRLYRYAEEKWYVHRIFDFSRRNSLDL